MDYVELVSLLAFGCLCFRLGYLKATRWYLAQENKAFDRGFSEGRASVPKGK